MSERNEAVKRSGWKQWTKEQAQQTLAEWKKSGASLTAFSRRRGISSQRLSWWRKRLNAPGTSGPKEQQEETPAQLVPAVVKVPLVDLGIGVDVSIRFPLAGPVVDVVNTTRVSPKWVGDLVEAVAAWRCLK